jgi:CubicO group peptidase (beta-lactamase class C family)
MFRSIVGAAIVVGAIIGLTRPGVGQSALPYGLFERYLDALREQTNIPGLSAAIVSQGRIEWERGFGVQEIEGSIPATPDTPYPVGSLTQTFATVVLGLCAERGLVGIDEPIRRWAPDFPVAPATVRHVLAHASEGAPAGTFRFDPGAFSQLTPVGQSCHNRSYRESVADEILERLGMASSVPGRDLANPGNPEREAFDGAQLDRYAAVLQRLAVPYRVDRTGRATRSETPVIGLNAADGLVTTVRDLARFDAALDDGILLRASTLGVAWTSSNFSGTPLPTGLAWFVQQYNGERVVWHFNHVAEGYSAMYFKMPSRRLTLILLANSDGLSIGANLEQGDVTTSPFVRIFLRLFA